MAKPESTYGLGDESVSSGETMFEYMLRCGRDFEKDVIDPKQYKDALMANLSRPKREPRVPNDMGNGSYMEFRDDSTGSTELHYSAKPPQVEVIAITPPKLLHPITAKRRLLALAEKRGLRPLNGRVHNTARCHYMECI